MTEISGTLMTEHERNLSLLDRAARWAAWALAGTIFLTVGWFAMAPDDPFGAVSVLTRRGAWMMLLQAAGLAAVTAALATVIAGRRLPDVGTFAAALGLAVVSLRGGTAGALLIQWADDAPLAQSSLPITLALETIAWFAIILIARGCSIAVGHWCFGGPWPSRPRLRDDPWPSRPRLEYTAEGRPSAVSRSGPNRCATSGEPQASACEDSPRGLPASRDFIPSAAQGVKHTLLAGGAALVVFKILTAGLSTRSVQHGQACFVVAASVCIALYLAYWIVPVRSALWSVLSAPLLAVGGYVWASVGSAPGGLPASVPASPFLRVLPIQYVAVGTAAAVAMFWYLNHPERQSAEHRHSSSSPAPPEGRG